MKNFLIIQAFFICIPLSNAQVIYVSTIQNEIFRLDIGTCEYNSLTTLSLPINDITFHPDGTLLGISNTCWLFTIDTINGLYFGVHQFLEDQCNSLTASANGLIYVTGPNSNLWTYNKSNGESKFLGNIGFPATGDLTFYKGNLYVASTEDRIVLIDLSHPSNSSVYIDGNIKGEIYGIVSYAQNCDSLNSYALTNGLSDVYRIDFESKTLELICELDIAITGGASTYEYLASLTGPYEEFSINICEGSSFEGYTSTGMYADTFPLSSGCDSIRTLQLNVISCLPIVSYDLDACESFMTNGSHMDYSEFIPFYPSLLSCADVSAHNVSRNPPLENKHSCTPGIHNSPAMCVTTISSCEYIAGNVSSIIIDFTINPFIDSSVQFTRLEFYEKAPAIYTWINGPSGPNNYPKFYGIRVLKNETEIFRRINIQTNSNWTLQSFNFLDDTLFQVKENTNFRIELLPYCPVGNGADVSVWDIDEIRVFGGCAVIQNKKPAIFGGVFTINYRPVQGVEMQLSNAPLNSIVGSDFTNESRSYLFEKLKMSNSYFVRGYKNDDVQNGVSVIDLVQIQRHLLGIAPFTSLHQYIAADINRSGNVSAIDLLELNKLLRGVYSEFPDNTSWRFGSLPLDMHDLDLSHFREINRVEFLNNDSWRVDFIGIKIGDLNGDSRLQNP